MIGYHYTIREAYEKIRVDGLHLFPLEKRHRRGCEKVLHLIGDGCIWVYPEFMRGKELIGMLMYVACRHSSAQIVCLEVEYPDVHSVSWMASSVLADDENFTLNHQLEMGLPKGESLEFAHTRRFDLIIQPVMPKDIYLAGQWDLIEFAQAGIIGTGERMVA